MGLVVVFWEEVLAILCILKAKMFGVHEGTEGGLTPQPTREKI